MALGGEWRLWVRRCISPPVTTSMSGQFLVEDGGLTGAVLRVRQRRHRKLSERHQAVERLVPVRHAVGADHGGGVLRTRLHDLPSLGAPITGASLRTNRRLESARNPARRLSLAVTDKEQPMEQDQTHRGPQRARHRAQRARRGSAQGQGARAAQTPVSNHRKKPRKLSTQSPGEPAGGE